VLEENGFIITHYFRDGKKDRNKYYFQESCWDTGKMNKCLDCGKQIDRGAYGSGPLGKIHYGCGGSVVGLKAIASAKAFRNNKEG
jgi:hypothetical protein